MPNQGASLINAGRVRQVVIFLTHRDSPRVFRHFERLRDDLRQTMPALLCLHRPMKNAAEPSYRPDIVVSVEDGRATIPTRYAEMVKGGRSYRGFADLTYMPAMLRPELSQVGYFWLVEEDVDFSGDWSAFFNYASLSDADLIGFDFVTRAISAHWVSWKEFSCPRRVSPTSVMKGFFPVARLSRRFLDTYREEIRGGGWSGHFEALYPTIASHHQMRIETIGRGGYRSAVQPLRAEDGGATAFATGATFKFRPVMGSFYFHEAPEKFGQPNRLFHPIKVDHAIARIEQPVR